jgi:hypothetical protein
LGIPDIAKKIGLKKYKNLPEILPSIPSIMLGFT